MSAYIFRGSATALLFSCVIVALSSAINLPRRHSAAPAPENDAAVGVNAQESTATAATSAMRCNRTLTLADRVAYQRAIEEVYWRYRIWPAANTGPKPSLDKVMSREAIEKKVEDYLRDSQALEDYWQKAITADQLQAEMERIANHTKQPGVLRELFAALGNDPLVISECLARPVLAERSLTELYAHDQRFHGELKRRAEAELQAYPAVDQMKQTSGTYSEIEWINSESTAAQDKDGSTTNAFGDDGKVSLKLNSNEWDDRVAKLAAQFGSQDVVGQAPRLPNGGLAAGVVVLQQADAHTSTARPDPLSQIKTGVLSPLQEDDARYYAVAVIKKGKDRVKLATVAWLKEPLRSWLAKAEAQVPMTMATLSANYRLPAISGQSGNSTSSVACSNDTWAPSSTTGAPVARDSHTAVWTDSEMIVWGGFGNCGCCGYCNDGGQYDPTVDSWTATSTTNAPDGRASHTAVWTGSEMIVWGGLAPNPSLTGGRYNPTTDSWTPTSIPNGLIGRFNHTAVWTGSEMIIWGGCAAGDCSQLLYTGGRYNPQTDSWTQTTSTNPPSARTSHTAVWTGSEMIVWGGYDGSNLINTGGRYNPGTNSWTATSTTNAPSPRANHTAVWTGSEMIAWGGFDSSGRVNTGGRYNPGTDSWTVTGTSNAPPARGYHTAVWTDHEMIVWGGYVSSGNYLNTGGRYDPGTDSWTATSISNAPVARYLHTAIWSGNEMIVWGGFVGNGDVNTGGRYCAQSGPTPTPTATPTATATPTPTPTPTPCTGRCSPTPRPRPTPRVRPTPRPRLTPPPTPTGSPRPTPAPRP